MAKLGISSQKKKIILTSLGRVYLCTLKNCSRSLNGVSSVETTSPLAAGRARSVLGGFGARSGGGSGNLRPSVGGRWRVETSWLERISSDSGLYLAARRLALQSIAGGILLSAPPLTCAAVRIFLMAGRPSCKVSVLFSVSARLELEVCLSSSMPADRELSGLVCFPLTSGPRADTRKKRITRSISKIKIHIYIWLRHMSGSSKRIVPQTWKKRLQAFRMSESLH